MPELAWNVLPETNGKFAPEKEAGPEVKIHVPFPSNFQGKALSFMRLNEGFSKQKGEIHKVGEILLGYIGGFIYLLFIFTFTWGNDPIWRSYFVQMGGDYTPTRLWLSPGFSSQISTRSRFFNRGWCHVGIDNWCPFWIGLNDHTWMFETLS